MFKVKQFLTSHSAVRFYRVAVFGVVAFGIYVLSANVLGFGINQALFEQYTTGWFSMLVITAGITGADKGRRDAQNAEPKLGQDVDNRYNEP